MQLNTIHTTERNTHSYVHLLERTHVPRRPCFCHSTTHRQVTSGQTESKRLVVLLAGWLHVWTLVCFIYRWQEFPSAVWKYLGRMSCDESWPKSAQVQEPAISLLNGHVTLTELRGDGETKVQMRQLTCRMLIVVAKLRQHQLGKVIVRAGFKRDNSSNKEYKLLLRVWISSYVIWAKLGKLVPHHNVKGKFWWGSMIQSTGKHKVLPQKRSIVMNINYMGLQHQNASYIESVSVFTYKCTVSLWLTLCMTVV